MKVAVVEGHDIGGTCVNRGCVPSKALLAASGRVREMKNEMHLKAMGIQVGSVSFDRQGIADHATNLAKTIQGNLQRSLEALGVDILIGNAKFVDSHTVKYSLPGRVDVGGTVTAKNIIIATGSVPFVPPGIPVDGKTVFTSDHALKLDWLPQWIAIIGSGYIGLEFSDVYTALGCEVTFVEAMPNIMPGFDKEIARLAERVLIKPRAIDYVTGVIASKVTPGVPGAPRGLLSVVFWPAAAAAARRLRIWGSGRRGARQRGCCCCCVRVLGVDSCCLLLLLLIPLASLPAPSTHHQASSPSRSS